VSSSKQIPRLGPVRVALLIALLQTPHRFRTKRQLWNYCGLGFADAEQRRIPVHRGTAAACAETTGAARSQRQPQSRSEESLSRVRPRRPGTKDDPLREFYQNLLCRRDGTADGAPDSGAQDCGHCIKDLEGRRTASSGKPLKQQASLSVTRARRQPQGSFPAAGHSIFR